MEIQKCRQCGHLYRKVESERLCQVCVINNANKKRRFYGRKKKLKWWKR